MYNRETRSIRISVEPEYLDDRSSPEDDYFFWAYTIRIENCGEEVVQLKTRYWRIIDDLGVNIFYTAPSPAGDAHRLHGRLLRDAVPVRRAVHGRHSRLLARQPLSHAQPALRGSQPTMSSGSKS